MNVVWRRAPVAAAAVAEELAAHKGWAVRTTRTLLDRLVKKRAVTYEDDGKRYLYRAMISLQDCTRQASRSFRDRVFGGRPAAMLIHLVQETDLTSAEIAELRRILESKEN
jgi:BlaI family transcriptional regulator, penicillinase repressor